MAERQKPWDQYEAVVLLEGFLDILSNNYSRNEVIARVSHDLRTMAINQGYEIDDVFRNKNGITFQIKSMESAYLGYTVMKPASKLFTETVALYRNSPSEYERMRKEAREMIDRNNEQKFMDYLASQVSHALFVEFSSFYPDIEAFCLKLHVLTKPLFETTDFETIKRVQQTIEQNKIFKITRRKNYAKIVAACRYYYVYVREGLFDTGKPMDAPSEAVQNIPSVATTTDASNITEQPVTDSVKPDISSNSPTASTEPKVLSLEEMVREALRTETEGNNYGTTVSFLQSHIRGGDRAKIKAILDSAEWAKFQFGRYYYVSKEAPVAETNDCPEVAPDSPAMPIERTESDKRLLQKYPIIYKRLFSSLLELTETHPKGVSVAELYAHISRVGRPSVIEEILDNVSWAASIGSCYLFSRNIVNQNAVSKKDFEHGCGEESAKAAAMVFGMGSMRRGSQGIINLGGLVGLNSALRDIERQQATSTYDSQPYVSPIEPTTPAIKKPAKTGLWREHCEDGSQYGLYPENFSTADDYADALKAAKEEMTAAPFVAEQMPSTDQELAQPSNRYRWRKYCEDGSKYGVFPEDYETADDYEDSLAVAKKGR